MINPWVEGLNSAEDVVKHLLENATESVKDDAVHDALLVFDFFPRLGSNFYVSPNFTEDQVEEFKKFFNYERYSLNKEAVLKKIEKYRSIERILDTLVKFIPDNIKNELVRKYLLEIWFKQNSKDDLEHFKSSLKRDYWLK